MNHNALQSDKNYAFINVGLKEKFIASCCISNKSRAFDLNLHFKIKNLALGSLLGIHDLLYWVL